MNYFVLYNKACILISYVCNKIVSEFATNKEEKSLKMFPFIKFAYSGINRIIEQREMVLSYIKSLLVENRFNQYRIQRIFVPNFKYATSDYAFTGMVLVRFSCLLRQ